MAGQRSDHGGRITVVGLGRFGTSVARTLHGLDYDVIALDLDERRVREIAPAVTLAAQGDGTNEDLLTSLDVGRSDVAIVALGEALEASVVATLLLKRIGVATVIATAKSDLHGELLTRIGADRVVYPEHESAVRLAHRVAVPRIDDYISLSASGGVAKLDAPPEFVGQSLEHLLAACRDEISVLLIKRGDLLLVAPDPSERVLAGDEIVVAGPDRAIETFVERAAPRARR